MSHKSPFNSTFHRILVAIDRELAEISRQEGCPCGGSLHLSNYPRSPLGLPIQFRPDYETRFSFCCNYCRKRTTPPSVRFFGRRRYPAPLLLLISALTVSINEYRLTQMKRHFGITTSESTWKRWCRWWREAFVETQFWNKARGSIPEPKKIATLPRRMLNAFQGLLDKKIILLLQFLSPITAGELRAV
jgi:hypothetical protein